MNGRRPPGGRVNDDGGDGDAGDGEPYPLVPPPPIPGEASGDATLEGTPLACRPRDRADVLLLRVRDSLSNQIVWFKVKTTTKFGKVYRAFAARQAGDGPQRAWIFSVPGSSDVISEDATPLDLGLTPESILEARPAPADAAPAAPAEPAAAAVPPAEPVAATE